MGSFICITIYSLQKKPRLLRNNGLTRKRALLLTGTIHGHEGSVHEKWPRICSCVFHYGAINV